MNQCLFLIFASIACFMSAAMDDAGADILDCRNGPLHDSRVFFVSESKTQMGYLRLAGRNLIEIDSEESLRLLDRKFDSDRSRHLQRTEILEQKGKIEWMLSDPVFAESGSRLARNLAEIEREYSCFEELSERFGGVYLISALNGGPHCAIDILSGVAQVGCPLLGRNSRHYPVQLVVFSNIEISSVVNPVAGGAE